MALKRIHKEWFDMKKDPSELFQAGPLNENDLFNWQAVILPPQDTSYSGGVYFITVRFPQDYPFKPPKCTFNTRIFHPNINNNGAISPLAMLHQLWSPAFTLEKVLQAIVDLLRNPDPDNPMVCEVAHLYKYNRQKFNQIAKEWNQKYAM